MEQLGPLQLRVMHALWRHGPATVHATHQRLNEEPGAHALAYTTILTVMRNLARRGFLAQDASHRCHVFTPLVDEESYKIGALQRLRDDLFDGSLQLMLELMRQDAGLSDREQDAIDAATDRFENVGSNRLPAAEG